MFIKFLNVFILSPDEEQLPRTAIFTIGAEELDDSIADLNIHQGKKIISNYQEVNDSPQRTA